MRFSLGVAVFSLAAVSALGQLSGAKSAQPSLIVKPTKDPLAEARAHPAKLIEKKFAELSDQKASEKGQTALDLAKNWRHGETDHFVIHFLRSNDALRLAREAEFYYVKIKLDLTAAEDRARGKSHLYLFDKDKLWEKFRPQIGLPDWADGVAIGPELFFTAEPGAAQRNSSMMAHELTHVIFHRFVARPVPLWLNEGFAEYESDTAYAKLKGVGQRAPGPKQSHRMTLEALTALREYPESTSAVSDFYNESERLVRFLLTRHDKKLFVPFVTAMTSGAKFEEAVTQTYGDKYQAFRDFERAYQFF